ncbi:hypothetical protein CASFOL_015342 [Castilleja foliolosa]|uniref:Uncharacterized protein n=1 Tax=Castilleja foliolosa TaxID=1961234 RepID=A0ABD3DH35_9LAMI
MDNNCISLAHAVEEMKDLDERLKMLEERAGIDEPVVLADDDDEEEQALPEIKARVYSTNILLKIQCEKRKGVLVNLLVELDKFDLEVSSASVVQFGSLVLDITITAEMGIEFSVPVKDVVTALRCSCLINCLR